MGLKSAAPLAVRKRAYQPGVHTHTGEDSRLRGPQLHRYFLLVRRRQGQGYVVGILRRASFCQRLRAIRASRYDTRFLCNVNLFGTVPTFFRRTLLGIAVR